MQFTKLLFTVFSTLHFVSVLALPTQDAPAEYRPGDLIWEGQITPGGPKITLAGTLESIYKAAVQLNPKFEVSPDDIAKMHDRMGNATNTDGGDVASTTGHHLQERTLKKCSLANTKKADINPIFERTLWVASLGGKLIIVGPNDSCGRLTCSKNSAIFLCKRKGVTLKVPAPEVNALLVDLVFWCPWANDKESGEIFSANGRYSAKFQGVDKC